MKFSFKNDWILSQLTDHCKDFVIEKGPDCVSNIAIKEVGENGFLASVFLITVEFSSGSKFEVVAKLCGRIIEDFESLTSSDFFLKGVHDRECLFYSKLAHKLPISIPRIYNSESPVPGEIPGFILMESLIGRGQSFHFSQSLNLAQLLALARFVAQLQSHAMLLEDQSWVEEFEKPNFDMSAQNGFIIATFERLKKIRNGELKSEAEILASHVSKDFMKFSQYKLHKEIGISSVLAHGDLWSHNVLWKTGNGQISDQIECIFDLQGAHAGQPAWDLARFLVLCTDADLRNQHTDEVLREYYASLEGILHEKGRQMPFSFKQVKECFSCAFVNQSVQFGCSLVYQKEDYLDVCEKDELPFFKARFEKVFLRAKHALREAVEILKSLKYD
ncbi:hypothetical protein L596_023138 [Steinernema carpocapsae]|uniref:CHK kinase-like domain-containing protein n=1 Tax=Steinernema carpocapsae TaxID=34508 RepID=A0A4U5MCT3_STECR|nr:hypothetical protein L596_023138 [Steinernema carpocapsae]